MVDRGNIFILFLKEFQENHNLLFTFILASQEQI